MAIPFALLVILIIGCKGEGSSASSASSMPQLDLLSHGVPLSIHAPEGAEVVFDDLGVMQDVTVKGDGNYSLQITGGIATTYDVPTVKTQLKEQVQSAGFFDEIIEEEENGFIYRKKISEDRINHDFRYVKIQGNQEYIFQTGLMGQYSLEDAKKIYNSVK